MTEETQILDHGAVRRAFGQAAARYDEHAVLQQTVEDRLLERLAFARGPQPERILDVGCGTGRGSMALLEHSANAQIIAMDAAPDMLQQLKNRKRWYQRRHPHAVCAAMEAIPLPDASIDQIFSNLALQWTTGLSQVFDEFRRLLRPDGLVLFTTFGPETLKELRHAWSVADEKPHVSGFFDIHDIGDAMVQAGFDQPVMDRELLTVNYAQPMGLLRDLQAIGATHAAQGRRRGLTGKRRLQTVLKAYEEFRRDDHVPATYEVIYGTAFGPAEGQPRKTPEGDVATFSLDSLRRRRG